MENNNNTQHNTEVLTNDQMLQEILENSRKTKSYIKWQLIITVALVVIPILATIALVPYAMKSLSSVYGIGLDGGSSLDSLESLESIKTDQLKELLQ
jgi:hypothetical protein